MVSKNLRSIQWGINAIRGILLFYKWTSGQLAIGLYRCSEVSQFCVLPIAIAIFGIFPFLMQVNFMVFVVANEVNIS